MELSGDSHVLNTLTLYSYPSVVHSATQLQAFRISLPLYPCLAGWKLEIVP